MQNQMCRVCDEPAAGFHFGAFTCEGCKSFFGRTCNNQSVIQECKNNYRCVVDKKNRTACKACRLRKCLMVGMSKSGSRYGRRSNWFKIHCLMQQSLQNKGGSSPGKTQPPTPLSTEVSPLSSSSLSPTSPPRSWTSSKDIRERHSPKIEERNKSPELTHSPTMVPRTTSINSTPSPFASLGLPQPPASPPKPPISEAPMPFYGFPPSFSLMSTPGLHSLPFHKQALLSPLLAHTHFLQNMARAQNPLLAAQAAAAAQQPSPDLMAEQHKVMMERLAAAFAAQNAAALAASQKEEKSAPSRSPTPPKTPEPQHAPMDLSSKRSDLEDSDNESEGESRPKKKKIKSDLNRNEVSEHETDDEELDVGENLSR